MDQAELRALQAPLKDRYRTDPDSAIAPVSARAAFVEPGITATVEGWAGPVRTGLHPTTGGDGSDACSGDLLLQALVGCAGVTLRSVATAMGLEIRSAEVRAEGVFDARGTLGMSRDVPVGLLDVVVTAVVDTDADDGTLERLRTGTERFCVVARSLAETPEFVIERARR
ncbi:OsmC family protein [Agromyces kandeliae]|uniref:OsmC family peroxiredoxin n=1 Tax=Agromyces kandeliae TaxID=2666141 RepID=A0A6L5R1M1_9MICO|nr:OsmC family protein [Agromyces kandeliae]MRX43931.1 OsmC family peroxiredoxin [Agromyces kandeliae]